jgi:colicin import membrane protein
VQAIQRRDPGANASAALAVGVHVLLALVLFFGIRWRTKHPEPVMAELWSQLPAVEAPRPEPPPPPVVAPKPEPKPEPPPPPKAEPKPEPKPDIALEQERKRKEEAEKKRREDEALKKKRDEEAAKKKREDELKAKAEQERKDKALAEQRRRDEQAADRKRMQAELARELAGAAPKSAAPTTAGASAVAGDPTARAQWGDRIRAKIRPNVVLPADLQGNPEAIFDVQLLPTGDVLAVKLKKSSGSRAYDDAVERAILKSSPLPLPEKREAFEARLELKFRPRE